MDSRTRARRKFILSSLKLFRARLPPQVSSGSSFKACTRLEAGRRIARTLKLEHERATHLKPALSLGLRVSSRDSRLVCTVCYDCEMFKFFCRSRLKSSLPPEAMVTDDRNPSKVLHCQRGYLHRSCGLVLYVL